ISYLERHARDAELETRFGITVNRIDNDDGAWVARTDDRDVAAAQMVVATGHEGVPTIPEWPGRADYTGELLHASDYRNPQPYLNRRVLVVGSGCSGMEIAYDLADGGAGKVWLSARTPPNIVLRQGPGPLPGDVIAKAFQHAPV